MMNSFQFSVFSFQLRGFRLTNPSSNRHPLFGRLMTVMLSFLLIVILFMLANWCFPLPKARLHPPVSQIVLDRNGEWLRAFLADDGMWRFSYQSQQIFNKSAPSLTQNSHYGTNATTDTYSPLLHQAILISEDRWFYYHYGINPISIATAIYDNLKAGEVVRGGSTITMQLARLMEPKARNIPNKFIEMFRAFQLEHAYSKSEILTFYFNMLPYGGNIVGTAAASRFYFNKPQHTLSLGEAALLAAIPNAPERLRPDRFPENARKAREKVLNRLLARRQISEQQWQEAVQEPIPHKRYPLPFKAPHLSRLLIKENRKKFGVRNPSHSRTTNGRIHTTIDAKVQDTAARLLSEYLGDAARKPSLRGSHSTSTGAIIVMDTQNRHILAMVGSHDFFDRKALGQINGTLAPRSPGSALKPFVYALAMQEGLITPETLLFDVPVTYADYTPVNYDGKYNGYVTARQALARSLNVPAVSLNARLKNRTLHAFLKQAGISTLAPAQKYGLSMVLGGCEVNLLELTTLYAGLANMGEFGPYQLTKPHQPKTENYSKRLLRQETSFIITEMLTNSQLPTNTVKNPEAFERTMNLPKIAWKTGTSYGHRDAWCIGYSPTFTIGVWLGNFDGKGTPMLSGTDAATPILFALFTALTGQDTHHWFTKPEQLKTRQVCTLSGAPVSPHCPTHKEDVYIPGVSSVTVCTIHKPIYVDESTGYSLCSHCWGNNDGSTGPSKKIFEEWPADAATWLAENGFAVSVLPAHNPLCTGTISGNAPIILSPAEDTTYYIREGVSLENQKIRLTASASSRTQDLFWFLDGELIFQGNAGEQYWLTPTRGKHVLTCVDAEGRSATRPLHISVIR
ncbi:penicillin-binding protein 1C [Candidatus Poribacteria bacterium]|nr:penicillin-binding protein 1C [Candidatus Poribacteria bacterium]MYA57579.1 penicillin-binding protein 1C [Candidatus Poribacteria bacterium]